MMNPSKSIISGPVVITEFGSQGGPFAEFADEVLRLYAEELGVGPVHVNSRRNDKDEGIDLEVEGASKRDHNDWMRSPSIWQHKAGTPNDTLLKKLKAEIAGEEVQKYIKRGYCYRVCLCASLPQVKQKKWEDELTLIMQAVHPAAPRVRILTADDIARLGSRYYTQIKNLLRWFGAAGEDSLGSLGKYIHYLTTSSSKIKLFGELLPTLSIEDVYVSLQAAKRENVSSTRAALSRQENELGGGRSINEDERRNLLDNYAFAHRAGLILQPQTIGLTEAVAKHQGVIVLGEPGSGKTTLLSYIQHKFASAKPDSKIKGLGYWRLPIYIPLSYMAGSSEDLAAIGADAAIASGYEDDKDQLRKLLSHFIEKQQVIFLFDGLDEVNTSQRRAVAKRIDTLIGVVSQQDETSLEKQRLGNRVVVTCRIAGYQVAPLPEERPHYVIMGLKTQDRLQFLQRWFDTYGREHQEGGVAFSKAWANEQAAKLTPLTNKPGINRLAEVPLLLSLIAFVWSKRGGKLPDTRAALYAQAVEHLIERHNERNPEKPLTQEDIYAVVPNLAFCMLDKRSNGMVEEEQAKRFIPNRELWMKLLEGVGLLAVRSSKPNELKVDQEEKLYGFPHLSFEEYFAARFIN